MDQTIMAIQTKFTIAT
ncbi:host cell division inhibitory peptide Kil, partial [Escherichia coli]